MSRLVKKYKRFPIIRLFAAQLVSVCEPKAWLDEIMLLTLYVRENIRFVQDINGVETLMDPCSTMMHQFGDCDDQSTLLATLCETVGHPSRFVAIGFQPDEYVHVYSEIYCQERGKRGWYACETTENVPFNWRPDGVVSRMVVHN